MAMSEEGRSGGSVLGGMRVLDLGEGVSAPFCARLFADYGAEVWKIEPPGRGDIARRWGPFPGDEPHIEKSGLFYGLNTGKRGATLDVSKARAFDLLLDLVGQADVLVENHLPEQRRALGLDYERLAERNPDLVMISITPFGQTGPYAKWKGHDLNAYHLSGASHRYCGRPDAAPLEHGTFSADFFGGYVGVAWGLAAWLGRELVGGGQHLDVSSAEAIAALFVGAQNIGGYAQDGVFERRTGVGMPLASPSTIVPCKDGHVWMMALEPGQWQGLVRAMGSPEWTELEMFQDMFTRAENRDLIYPLIEEWTREHTKQEIMDLCQENGCPTTAVYDVAEAVDHPHLAARGFLHELEHPALGRVRTLGAPVRLPNSPGGPGSPAPLLGQHNAELYGERLGLSAREIDELRREGVI